MTEPPRDLTRILIAGLSVGALILCSALIIRPFLPATIWAGTIVVATWPLLQRLQHLLDGRRGLAVLVTTLVILGVFVAPFWIASSTILSHAGELSHLADAASSFRVPEVPQWIRELPLIGPGIAAVLAEIEDLGLADLTRRIAPYAGQATGLFIGLMGSFGVLVFQFLLTVGITALFHMNGEAASRVVIRFGNRLGGTHGEQLVVLATEAIRAVAIGVMVTALAEALVGGIGLWLAGVPLAGVLTAVMFVICVAQLGPGVVLIPAVLWMYWFRDAGHATLLLVALVIALLIDNVLRPFLIRKEADLPTLLVLAGVIGGLAEFGLIGIFIGPAILAVSYTLLQAWLDGPPAMGSAAPVSEVAPAGVPAVPVSRTGLS